MGDVARREPWGRSLRLLCVLGLLLTAWPAWAGGRVALLIGNSQYEYANALPNPANDVDLLARTLSASPLGFEVEAHTDLTQAEMARVVFDFLKRTEDADLTLFFFAGHGLQYEEENYLLGVEARLETPFALTSEALVLNDLIDMIRSDQRTALVFIDACRNNPLARSFYAATYGSTRAATTRGLARIDLPPGEEGGIMLAFSASPGQVAVDGPEGGNSPFAQALASHIQTPGVEVLSVMRRVMRDVRAETASQPEPQVPIFTADLVDEIYLAALPDPVEAAPDPSPQSPGAAPDEVGSSQEAPEADLEMVAFATAMEANTIDALAAYLANFPNGRFVATAARELARLQTGAAAQSAVRQDPAVDPVGEQTNTAALGVSDPPPQSRHGAPDEPGRDLLTASQGDPGAQFDLGNLYFDGDGVAQDYLEAARWFRLAADQGDAPAQTRLGYMYYHGLGVDQDYAEAIRLWRQAADAGYAKAQTNLGQAYRSGRGVPQDYAEAVRWYRLATAQNYSPAQNGLGYMYEYGLGVSQNHAEALSWYRLAANQGDRTSQNNLGYMYFNGIGVLPDPAEAVKWWRQAANQGHAGAQNSLGNLYKTGQGIPQDYTKAAEWFRLAADQGDATGQWNLGRLYANGQGVRQDSRRAAELIVSAYQQDEASAEEELVGERAANLPENVRREIQNLLQAEGFYRGAIDGAFGPSTIDALDAFARR